MTTTPTQELNGVDTETLFATIGAVRNQPELARFQFRTTTEYVRGTHNRTTFGGFHGAGAEHEHRQTYTATPTTRPSWSARTTHPRRPSTCCRHSAPASPAAWPTSLPPGHRAR